MKVFLHNYQTIKKCDEIFIKANLAQVKLVSLNVLVCYCIQGALGLVAFNWSQCIKKF